jgi:alkylhydroperoxidase family enzyme
MARIPPMPVEAAAPEARRDLERQLAAHGRVTNMKRTLARSPAALRALMTWYDLHAEVVAFLGPRLTTLFAHGVSSQTDCLICSTFFRRWLVESGEDPDALRLNDREEAIVEYGRQIARDANAVSDDLYNRAARHMGPDEMVTLTAFAGMMIATNVFNNALRVDLDDYLRPFRKGGKA